MGECDMDSRLEVALLCVCVAAAAAAKLQTLRFYFGAEVFYADYGIV